MQVIGRRFDPGHLQYCINLVRLVKRTRIFDNLIAVIFNNVTGYLPIGSAVLIADKDVLSKKFG